MFLGCLSQTVPDRCFEWMLILTAGPHSPHCPAAWPQAHPCGCPPWELGSPGPHLHHPTASASLRDMSIWRNGHCCQGCRCPELAPRPRTRPNPPPSPARLRGGSNTRRHRSVPKRYSHRQDAWQHPGLNFLACV